MNHYPQLTRFYSQADVQGAIAACLREVEMAIGQGEAAYKTLSEKLQPQVFELGFLR